MLHSLRTILSYRGPISSLYFHHAHATRLACSFFSVYVVCRGGDLGGLGGRPPKIEVGDGPCILPPPPIFWSSVVGCARKYEQSKKNVFLVRKGSYTTFNIGKIREKKWKIRKTRSMTKKGHKKFLPWKGKFFPEKTVIQKSWSAKKFCRHWLSAFLLWLSACQKAGFNDLS